MSKNMKPSITISEGAQNLFMELLSKYEGVPYNDLPSNIKSVIDEYQYHSLIGSLKSNKEVSSRFSKLYVLVDYINAFVNGSLGSEAAKSIEENVYNQLKNSLEDEETAVVILIDSHYNDDTYLSSREGRHLPVLHANTKEERLLYGKVGEILNKYYDNENEVYESNEKDGIWFIEKSQFGCLGITEEIDYNSERYTDELFELMDRMSDDIDKVELSMKTEYSWNHLYDTAINLALVSFIPNEITIAGVATNICVLSNAIILQNQFPQSEIFINSKTVASYDSDLHIKSLEIMKGLGINVKE